MKTQKLSFLLLLLISFSSCKSEFKDSEKLADNFAGEWQVESVVYKAAAGDSSVLASDLGFVGFHVGCDLYNEKTKNVQKCSGYYRKELTAEKLPLEYSLKRFSEKNTAETTPEGAIGNIAFVFGATSPKGGIPDWIGGFSYIMSCDGATFLLVSKFYSGKYETMEVKAKKIG